MPAGNADGGPGHEHARADHFALIDGIAQGDVAIAFRADIAHRREAGKQCPARILDACDGHALVRQGERFIGAHFRVAGQVRVHVDEAGQDRLG